MKPNSGSQSNEMKGNVHLFSVQSELSFLDGNGIFPKNSEIAGNVSHRKYSCEDSQLVTFTMMAMM